MVNRGGGGKEEFYLSGNLDKLITVLVATSCN